MNKLLLVVALVVGMTATVLAQSSNIILNEFAFDLPADIPGTPAIEGDANRDGFRSPRADEFLEFYNRGTSPVNISGWQVLERDLIVVFTFPYNTILQPREMAVVFGGVDVGGFTGTFPPTQKIFAAKFGQKDSGFAAGTKTNFIGGSAYDNIILVNPAVNDTIAEVFWGTRTAKTSKGIKLIAPNTVGGDSIVGAIGQSVTRSPDFTGLWARHRNVAKDSAYYSPGAKIDGTVVSVERDEQAMMPSRYYLYQNYPNPFNPSTEIRFELPEHGYTILEVFDLTGKRVDKLLDQQIAAGSYSVKWKADHLPSGVYLYKLTAETFVRVKKMTLIR